MNELLPRQALAMHGTADALATVSADVTDRLRPLAEKIDAFRRDPSATIKSEEFQVLQDDIAAGGLDVDASKIGDKIIIQALKETTGIQGLALPDKIDRETMNCARIISRRKA